MRGIVATYCASVCMHMCECVCVCESEGWIIGLVFWPGLSETALKGS